MTSRETERRSDGVTEVLRRGFLVSPFLSLCSIIRATMNIDVRKQDDVVIIDFKGRLAAGVSDELLTQIVNELLAEGYKKILLNLSDMEYIDSSGLGDLVQSLKVSNRAGASLRLLKPQDRVTKTLRLTNLLPMFSVYESEKDALAAFGSA